MHRIGPTHECQAHYDGIVAFSQTDFTEDLKKFTVPTLVMHGDDDQIVPYADSGPLIAKLVKGAILQTYKGFPHGMPTTNAARSMRIARIHSSVTQRRMPSVRSVVMHRND